MKRSVPLLLVISFLFNFIIPNSINNENYNDNSKFKLEKETKKNISTISNENYDFSGVPTPIYHGYNGESPNTNSEMTPEGIIHKIDGMNYINLNYMPYTIPHDLNYDFYNFNPYYIGKPSVLYPEKGDGWNNGSSYDYVIRSDLPLNEQIDNPYYEEWLRRILQHPLPQKLFNKLKINFPDYYFELENINKYFYGDYYLDATPGIQERYLSFIPDFKRGPIISNPIITSYGTSFSNMAADQFVEHFNSLDWLENDIYEGIDVANEIAFVIRPTKENKFQNWALFDNNQYISSNLISFYKYSLNEFNWVTEKIKLHSSISKWVPTNTVYDLPPYTSGMQNTGYTEHYIGKENGTTIDHPQRIIDKIHIPDQWEIENEVEKSSLSYLTNQIIEPIFEEMGEAQTADSYYGPNSSKKFRDLTNMISRRDLKYIFGYVPIIDQAPTRYLEPRNSLPSEDYEHIKRYSKFEKEWFNWDWWTYDNRHKVVHLNDDSKIPRDLHLTLTMSEEGLPHYKQGKLEFNWFIYSGYEVQPLESNSITFSTILYYLLLALVVILLLFILYKLIKVKKK